MAKDRPFDSDLSPDNLMKALSGAGRLPRAITPMPDARPLIEQPRTMPEMMADYIQFLGDKWHRATKAQQEAIVDAFLAALTRAHKTEAACDRYRDAARNI